MIGGAGIGAFIAANNGKAIKATFRIFGRLRRSNKYDKALYMELLALQYKMLTKIRRDGMLGIERDIDNPQESVLFNEHPRVLADPLIMAFLIDYLRLMVSGSMDPMELDELMLHEIEAFEQEAHVPADAIAKVGDAMPAFGIVAAVMGVVKALSTADAAPDEMGQMIAHALVGTFLGILAGYGFVNPLASRVERQAKEVEKILQCMRVTLLASLHGYAPSSPWSSAARRCTPKSAPASVSSRSTFALPGRVTAAHESEPQTHHHPPQEGRPSTPRRQLEDRPGGLHDGPDGAVPGHVDPLAVRPAPA